jgi:hypothetical protein
MGIAVLHGAELVPSKKTIAIDNRVLATVRGQIITVVDIMKKLDMLFYQQFPQYRGSTEAKFEFYKTNWRRVFEDLVDRQLVLAWAEDREYHVSNGELREELEQMFGPNVMMNLYEAGLSVHEVQEMMRADILMRRVIGFYVRMPVMSAITPEVIRVEYERQCEEAKKRTVWAWKSVTIRVKEGDCSKEIAEKIAEELQKTPPEQIKVSKEIEVLSSQTFHSKNDELAPSLQELFQRLPEGVYSEPVEFVSRSSSAKSWRCYFLEKKEHDTLPPFSELEELLREHLAAPEIEEKSSEFFADLRKQYHVQQSLSSDTFVTFEPFALHQQAV